MISTHKALETFPEELEIFERPTVQNAVESSFFSSVVPLTTNLNSDIIEFDFSSSEHFIDLSESLFYLQCSIQNLKKIATQSPTADNTTPTPNTAPSPVIDAAPVNAFFYALFDRIDVELNGTPIEAGYNNLAYKGYFKTLFNRSSGASKVTPRGILWSDDTPRYFDDAELGKTGRNLGLKTRYLDTQKQRKFEMYGRLMHEIFHLHTFILPNTRIRIKLYRKDPTFCLMAKEDDPTYRVDILNAVLRVRFIKLDQKAAINVEKKLTALSPACYVLPDCVSVKERQLMKGSRMYAIENFFANEPLPSKVTFALIPHDAYVGSYKLNPFNFLTHNLEEISLTIDNQTERFNIDEQGKNYLQLFTALSSEIGNEETGVVNALEYDTFLKGYALFPFDLCPTRTMCDLQIPKVKNVRLELKFKEALQDTVELLCFIENTHVIHIDKMRRVTKVC